MARIILGVSGGIAAYKAAELASRLTQRGDEVITAMTPSALKFITPLTFRAVTRQPVYTDTFEDTPDANTEHISIAQWAELTVLAPATADLVGRMAAGLANDVVTTTVLALDSPVLVCPAMNDVMWANPLVQRNLETLREIGMRIVEPESGHLACGSVGPGRLAPTEVILEAMDETLREGAGHGGEAPGPGES